MTWRMIHADCLEAMAEMDESSVDAIVTDPPYGLEFMGKEWDRFVPEERRLKEWDGRRRNSDGEAWEEKAATRRGQGGAGPSFSVSAHYKPNTKCQTCGLWEFDKNPCRCEMPRFEYRPRQEAPTQRLGFQAWCEAWATEALRVLRPGGHLLAFGGTRTIHRLICALEDAGFEIRDMLCWIYGSGFPKSLNVSVALESLLPADARCACGLHSTRTAPDSPVGYPSSDGSDGARPPRAGGAVRVAAPSRGDAHERSHGDQRGDAQAAELAHSRSARSGPLASEDSPRLWEPQEVRSRSGDSRPSDTPSNTSPDGSKAERRTAARIPDTLRSGDGSESWDKHIPRCEGCGGWYVEPGFGTALKPGWEGITLARKPLAGTVAANVLEHGTGTLNIDGTRIEATDGKSARPGHSEQSSPVHVFGPTRMHSEPDGLGRWPANVLLDEQAAEMLDEQSGELHSQDPSTRLNRKGAPSWSPSGTGRTRREPRTDGLYADRGGASRFFYTAKASSAERHGGMEYGGSIESQVTELDPNTGAQVKVRRNPQNNHPTVKPVELMQWLCRLITPPGGTILDPFTGSGSTGIAALREGFDFIGIEREADYVEIARDRIIGDAPLFNVETEVIG